jgi:hypothetical protein
MDWMMNAFRPNHNARPGAAPAVLTDPEGRATFPASEQPAREGSGCSTSVQSNFRYGRRIGLPGGEVR